MFLSKTLLKLTQKILLSLSLFFFFQTFSNPTQKNNTLTIMEKPAPHGSTQTPVEAGGEAKARTTTKEATATKEEESHHPAAPQPQDVEPEDAEQVKEELRKLTREVSEHAPAQPAALATAAAQKETGEGERAPPPEEKKEQAKEEQVGADHAVGAADAGAAAVELAEQAVEGALGAVESALGTVAHKLGFGKEEEGGKA
jgi:hypothetical protein